MAVWHLAFHVRHQGHGQFIGKDHIEVAGDEGEDSGRAVGDDGVFDPVQIGPTWLPVVRVATDLDTLVALVFDELERSRADRRPARIAWRDMAGVYRRKA